MNLLASVIRSRGGYSPHRELGCLPAKMLKHAAKVIYVVVDGLGTRQLDDYLGQDGGQAFFRQHSFETLTTVFPATTAAAVTTFATGATPAEHGILGWYLNLADLGLTSAILPVTTRTGLPALPETFDLGAYLALPTYLESTEGLRVFLAHGEIATSRYSRAGTRWTATGSFRALRGMERQATRFVRQRGRGLAYVYWPEYDLHCHLHGTRAAQTVRHLDEIDQSLGRLAGKLRGTDTVLLVVADHGLVDVMPRRLVNLAGIKGFYDTLTTLPTGDARQISCFVRPRREQAFLQIVRTRLAACCVGLTGEQVLSSGVLGPGKVHPALGRRLGDYILLARDGYGFAYPIAGGRAHGNIGNHGGMSETEMLVPLFTVAG